MAVGAAAEADAAPGFLPVSAPSRPVQWRPEYRRLRYYDPALRVEALRTVAYRYACRCGFVTPWRARVARAREDCAEHTHEAS